MKPSPSQDNEGSELGFFEDDATDILEAANQVQLNDRRDNQQPKVDADFFNRFDDDADESDMNPPTA